MTGVVTRRTDVFKRSERHGCLSRFMPFQLPAEAHRSSETTGYDTAGAERPDASPLRVR